MRELCWDEIVCVVFRDDHVPCRLDVNSVLALAVHLVPADVYVLGPCVLRTIGRIDLNRIPAVAVHMVVHDPHPAGFR